MTLWGVMSTAAGSIAKQHHSQHKVQTGSAVGRSKHALKARPLHGIEQHFWKVTTTQVPIMPRPSPTKCQSGIPNDYLVFKVLGPWGCPRQHCRLVQTLFNIGDVDSANGDEPSPPICTSVTSVSTGTPTWRCFQSL
jgi:hypothetical protein